MPIKGKLKVKHEDDLFPSNHDWADMRTDKFLLQTFSVLACAFLMTGCLSTLLGTSDSRSKDYILPSPGTGWEKIDPAEADAAFRNKSDRAILNVSSVCGEERFKSLEELSEDVLNQLGAHTAVEPAKPLSVAGHPALITEVNGTMDGDTLKVRLAVIRTEHCLYDLILAGVSLDQSSRYAFDQALAGFSDGSKQ